MTCFAYCLMPNHYHLIVQTPDGRLSEAMKLLNGQYALRFNRRYSRDAHLFKNRFGAVAQMTDEQFLWTLRYAVRNPVESGLCSDPGDWPWSSYLASVGEAPPPPFLGLTSLLSHFGGMPESAMARYRAAVAA